MWYMNEERAMIRDMVRNFTQNEVKAAVKEMEENDAYPHELMRKAGDLGILGLAYPEEVGGQGQDFVNLGIAIEEIAKESPCAALCVLLSGFLGARPICDLGTPEQKEKILKPIIEGKEIFVNSLTEPVGINNWFDYRTTAVLDGDEWVINGGKIFATNAGTAISWRNALKTLDITNQNTKYITAMKVNCDSDTYGISLVNPSGSNVIYNFDSVMDKLNYSVDDNHINPNTNNPYTLAELVTLWKSTFNSSITSYRSLGNSLIENTKKLETYTELLQVAFAKYQKFTCFYRRQRNPERLEFRRQRG